MQILLCMRLLMVLQYDVLHLQYKYGMEADSSTKSLHKNWSSSETLDQEEDTLYVCNICKVREDFGLVKVQKLLAEEQNNRIFFVQSKIFLLCYSCQNIYHLHCHLNQEITLDLLIETIENELGYACHQCKEEEERRQEEEEAGSASAQENQ